MSSSSHPAAWWSGTPLHIGRGEQVKIVIDVDGRSFRFHARGVWLDQDGDNYKVGLVFVGVPICLHQVQLSAHLADLVDQISSAA